MPEILDLTGDDDPTPAVEQAALALRDGGLVVLPTDTAYGLAADAFSMEGTDALYRLREQARTTPLPVMVRSPKQLIGLTPTVPDAAERLMAAFWPGALTIVLAAEPSLRWDLGDTDGTVAVRMPLDDLALAVIRAVGPLAVTGAHRAGDPVRTTVGQIAEDLGDDVALYLDAGVRDAEGPSTIVDLTRREPHLLREGALPAELVLAVARGELDPLDAADAVDGGVTRLDELTAAEGAPPETAGSGEEGGPTATSDATEPRG